MIWVITILISYVFALWASVWGIKQGLLKCNIPTTVGNISSEMFENPVEVTVRSFEYIIKDDSYVYILSNGLFIDEYHLEEILYKPKESKESKAQQYIWDYTKNCNNQLLFEDKDHNKYYEPWLTPDHALSAVQIAKEEFIERAIEWFNKVAQESDNGINIKFKCHDDLINNFKKYVEV